jgi:hypothetical protein
MGPRWSAATFSGCGETSDGPRGPSGLLAVGEVFFERRNFACGITDAPGASRNFIHMFLDGRMHAQKIVNEISVSHDYRYMVADLMGIEPDHAKSRFQLLATFLAAYIQ